MLEKVQEDRLNKLRQIRELGVDPYGGRYDTAEPVADVLARYEQWEGGQADPASADIADHPRGDAAGRLVLIRDMGKMMFCHLRDESGQMQIALRKDRPGKPPAGLDDEQWRLAKLLDLGDLVAVRGPVQRTRTNEITIWAKQLTLLCKSLNPMPEKFHGLQDRETRYRRRYLDLMTNVESMERFKRRVAIIEHIRERLRERGFLEVETPMMQQIYGGAAARPFMTHHNALDLDLYMRISPELYLKRLLVGGFEKVFEINRNFRNEGLDTRHNPEFTMLELYQACADYHVMMEITEELISTAARMIELPALLKQHEIYQAAAAAHEELKREVGDAASTGTPLDEEMRAGISAEYKLSSPMRHRPPTLQAVADSASEGRCVIPYDGKLIDLTPPWRRAKYADLFAEHAGMSMDDAPAVRAKARQLGIEEANKDDAVVVNEVFEETVEPHLVQPTFVLDYPAAICPLTRRCPDNPDLALRFELFIANMEIANAYTELNDPAVQEANFRAQLRGEDDNEFMRAMDEDFITALRHGMPPAGGLGVGIDRVVMLLTDTPSIRDVILFPLLRPREDASASE